MATSRNSNRALSLALSVLGAALLIAGAIALYAREQIVDPEAFGDRAVESLRGEGVRRAIRREIVTDVIRRADSPFAEAARPRLRTASDRVVASERFEAVFRAAAIRTNRAFFVGEAQNALLDLGAAGPVVADEVRRVSPTAARLVPDRLDIQVITLRRDEFPAMRFVTAGTIRTLGVVLPLLAVLFLAGAVAVAADRGQAVLRVGVAVLAAGALLAGGLAAAREFGIYARTGGVGALSEAQLRDAVADIFDAYLGDLFRWALWIGLAGLVLVAVGAAIRAAARRRRLAAGPPARG